jgi:hypothetical protein
MKNVMEKGYRRLPIALRLIDISRNNGVPCDGFIFKLRSVNTKDTNTTTDIGLNGKFLRFRRDVVSISYTVICLSHFDVCLGIT